MKNAWIGVLIVVLLASMMPMELHTPSMPTANLADAMCHDSHDDNTPLQEASSCAMGLCCFCPVILSFATPSALPTARVKTSPSQPRVLLAAEEIGIFRPPRS